MPIADLQPRQGKVEVEAEVVDKGEIREFNKFGKVGRVCNAKIRDDSGEIAFTLWNEQIDQVNVGDKIKVSNGYVNEWQGEMQLTTGKFGKLEILGRSEAKADENAEDDPAAVEKDSGKGEQTIDEDDGELSEEPVQEEEKIE